MKAIGWCNFNYFQKNHSNKKSLAISALKSTVYFYVKMQLHANTFVRVQTLSITKYFTIKFLLVTRQRIAKIKFNANLIEFFILFFNIQVPLVIGYSNVRRKRIES